MQSFTQTTPSLTSPPTAVPLSLSCSSSSFCVSKIQPQPFLTTHIPHQQCLTTNIPQQQCLTTTNQHQPFLTTTNHHQCLHTTALKHTPGLLGYSFSLFSSHCHCSTSCVKLLPSSRDGMLMLNGDGTHNSQRLI